MYTFEKIKRKPNFSYNKTQPFKSLTTPANEAKYT